MAIFPAALVAHKQEKFSIAAFVAIKTHDAEIAIVPTEAKLSTNDSAVISKDPRQFDVCLFTSRDTTDMSLSCTHFTFWSGYTRTWLNECFGLQLVQKLVSLDLIKLGDHPAPAPKPQVLPGLSPIPQVQVPSSAAQHLPSPTYYDLESAEAAGFHRAINLWNVPIRPLLAKTRGELHAQAVKPAELLAGHDYNDAGSLPGKFASFRTHKRPSKPRMRDGMPLLGAEVVLGSSYYDVYLNALSLHRDQKFMWRGA
ncbi:hypothetical protein G6011_00923 [Alternaria panax]|uniref:Uncharacterized protein n=1 Tax=Alternaria panax TaxID=48097 RepID=A0AAD4NV53_9PLEO|nr:hypothetical protein G6011_00923 [Alternaria panax]